MGTMLRRLLFLLRRDRFDRDLEDELRFHEEMKARALADSNGLSADEARSAARRRLGSPVRLGEQSRDVWVFATAESFARDVAHALRLLRRDPGFTFAALATLALGIGLATTVFSVAYGVLWRPLPYPAPDRLVVLSSAQLTENGPRTFSSWAPVTYDGLRDHAKTLHQLAAYSPMDVPLTGRGEPLQVHALDVSPNFFTTLGVAPVQGRGFLAGAAVGDDRGSVVVSDRLWRTTLHADPAIVGQTITVDGVARTIVGVLPPDFSFRPVIRIGALPEADVFLPNDWRDDEGGGAFLFLVGRLQPGVGRERAEAELTALVNDPAIAPAGALAPEGALARDVHTVAHLVGLQEHGTQAVRTLLLVLLGAVSFVLLIACINVANLQMARLTARRGELSVRLALGAGRRRIVRQLLTEGIVLSLLGTALGVLLARVAIDVALPFVPPLLLPRLGGIVIDARVLVFSLGLSLVCTMLVGLMPAFRLAGAGSGAELALHAGTRTVSDPQGERLRTVLVAAQVAITLVLLIAAGLLVHSFLRLTSVSPGFETSGKHGVVQTVKVTLPVHLYDEPARMHAFARGVLERILASPGVESASLVNSAPFGMFFIRDAFEIEGRPRPTLDVGRPKIDADYFRTMGIPLLAGREFTTSDTATAPKVAILSERIVREYFPGGVHEALGRRVRLDGDGDWLSVVGVVADVRQSGLDRDVQPMLYVPYGQVDEALFLRFVSFVARTTTPARVAEAMRAEIRRVSPDLPIQSALTMDEAVAASVASPRFRMLLLVLFAAAAMLIATCGIYGLMAYAVAQRRREIGVHMALGASRRDVARLVLTRALRIVGAGLLGGLVVAAAVTRVLQRFLFGVTPTDPVAFAAVTLLLLTVALAAVWLPARRAARIDPWAALRAD